MLPVVTYWYSSKFRNDCSSRFGICAFLFRCGTGYAKTNSRNRHFAKVSRSPKLQNSFRGYQSINKNKSSN